jgi:hypothetical protein
MNRCRRSIFFIDPSVQGTLLVRVAIYWLFCLLSITLMLICWRVYSGPPQRFFDLLAAIFQQHAPALAASLIVLPVVMMDVLRLSNRFVGPVMRLRGGLKELADGRPAQPLNFRDNDFWRDAAADFNRVAARVAHASAERGRATEAMSAAENADAALEVQA